MDAHWVWAPLLVGAAVLLFVIHASVFVGVYLAVNGLIVVSALFVERRRYRSRGDRTQGDFQATGERFVDPTVVLQERS